MDLYKTKKDLVETGHELLKRKLTARTWGNISGRVDGTRFLITPSGLDYMKTREEDIVLYNITDGTYEGARKPSSEKGIHAAAYEIFPDVNFIIHTHQTYATAAGLSGWDSLQMTEEEKETLGTLARADYGLPGQKSLRENVRAALKKGAKIVFMVNHGALICGSNMEDALSKAELLEKVCMRKVCEKVCERKECMRKACMPDEASAGACGTDKGTLEGITPKGSSGESSTAEALDMGEFPGRLQEEYPFVRICSSPEVLSRADSGREVPAELDDMAQMIGRKIPVVRKENVKKALRHKNAMLVPGIGAVVCGRDADDSGALCLLTEKAVITRNHTEKCGVKAELPLLDVLLMHTVYDLKYSKQKG